MKKARIAALLFSLGMVGCAPFPYPHRAYLNSEVKGEIVSAVDGKSIPNLCVRLGKSEARTDSNGRFELKPVEEQRYWKIAALPIFYPLEPFWDLIEIDFQKKDATGKRVPKRYKVVDSYRYTRIYGLDFDQKNKDRVVEMGRFAIDDSLARDHFAMGGELRMNGK